MSLADDLGDLLTSDGLSSTVHIGELKAKPDKALVVIPTAGLPNMRTFGSVVLETRRVQVLTRASDYPTAESLMSSANGFLDGVINRTLNGTVYHWIELNQPPNYIGLDEAERPVFSANYTCMRAAST